MNYHKMYSDEEIQMVHESSLEVLAKTGFLIEHQGALEKLADAGAKVDMNTQRARFPRELVEKCINTMPDAWLCAARDELFDLPVNMDTYLSARSAGGAIKRYHPDTGKIGMLTNADCAEYARVTDALENIDIVGTITPSDLPLKTYDIHTLRTFLENTRKHQWVLTIDSKNLAYELEMLAVVAGGEEELRKRPIASGLVCIIEPFYFPHDEIERLLLYGKYNLPIRVPLMPVSGANAPYTLAGIVNMMNAEFLGSQVLLQTLCPGIPNWYYTTPQSMDMKTGRTMFVTADSYPIQAAFKQLAQMYNVPISQSLITTSATQYPQYIFDRAAGLMWAAALGAQGISAFGVVDSANIIIPANLVLDNEMISFARFASTKMEINEQTLAGEAISRVGPKGHFMTDPHTMDFLRKEKKFTPNIFDWRGFDAWNSDAKDIVDRAREKLNHILECHEVPPLDKAVQKEIDCIVDTADKELL